MACNNDCSQGRDCPEARHDGAVFVVGIYGLFMLVVGLVIGLLVSS